MLRSYFQRSNQIKFFVTIIDANPNGNNDTPFCFLFGLTVVSAGLLVLFLDLKRSKVEQERFLAEEEVVRMKREVLAR